MPSTVIRSYRYDRHRRARGNVFPSRRRSTCRDLPEETYEAMTAALSKGEFFNRRIRDHFTFERNGKGPASGLS